MSQQTLIKPSRQMPEETKGQSSRKAPQRAHAPATHRRPRARSAGGRSTRGDWQWAALGLVVVFVLSLLAGALLSVHGTSGSASADGHAVTLEPETASPEPVQPEAPFFEPVQKAPAPTLPVKKPTERTSPAGPGKEAARPAGIKEVPLRPGDTLWALAKAHGATVKTLQQLNGLGSSTLIYAGEVLRVPAGPDSPDAAQRSKATPPTSAAKPTVKPEPTAKPVVKSAAKSVIAYAQAQSGKPYIWGGTGPRGFDCSGLVMRAWEAAGVKLPRTTWGQAKAGKATTRAKLVPGDLVITAGGGHVQLYIGDGKAIHSPRS
ncbi:NlpC/P60 family protein, partial [Streptomyces sp. NPDC058439]|uniref:C40 family peptidase n=1 Tax=Streptomyces sp. NPDC058439 TaxID=3346500 RepID=UPI0036584949